MKIYYNSHTAKWYQAGAETPITFGGDRYLLPYQNALLKNSYSFTVNLADHHAGPLIGIMTSRKADGTITGNSSLFLKLQRKILAAGGLSYIFTPEDLSHDHINGYMYLEENRCWKKVKAPFPDLVYNRIPHRKVEQKDNVADIFKLFKKKQIPFFNPFFLDKYNLYCLFQDHPALKNYMPNTELVTNMEDLRAFLEKHRCVYLKPAHSAKGNGIFRLSLLKSKQLSLDGLNEKETYPHMEDFWNEWQTELLNKRYLVQKAVKSAKFKGKRFDFRILAHAKDDGYSITGVGIRQSHEQEITTHIPNGGKLLPYHLLQTVEHDQFFHWIVEEIGTTLSKHYGFFGEFSIDAGISTTGEYFIYEVNSKPMSFDETDIEEKKISQLTQLFLQLTKFLQTPKNSFHNAN